MSVRYNPASGQLRHIVIGTAAEYKLVLVTETEDERMG